MKILFYDTKNYDKESFNNTLKSFPEIEIEYTKSDLDPRTANLAKGFSLEMSVQRAKAYISGALAAMLDLGNGSGPLDHGFAVRGEYI